MVIPGKCPVEIIVLLEHPVVSKIQTPDPNWSTSEQKMSTTDPEPAETRALNDLLKAKCLLYCISNQQLVG